MSKRYAIVVNASNMGVIFDWFDANDQSKNDIKDYWTGGVLIVDSPSTGYWEQMTMERFNELYTSGPTLTGSPEWWVVYPREVVAEKNSEREFKVDPLPEVAYKDYDVQGWYEFIKRPEGTSHIAFVKANGVPYIPIGVENEKAKPADFLMAALRGEAYKLVRETKG